MIALHQIQIPAPCHEDWNAMHVDAQARYCGTCRKLVHDLSQMTEAQAQALLDRTGANVCVRFARLADGRVLTLDTVTPVKKLAKPRHRVSPHHAKPRVKPPASPVTGEAPLPPQPLQGAIAVRRTLGKPAPPKPPTPTMGAPLPPVPHPTPAPK